MNKLINYLGILALALLLIPAANAQLIEGEDALAMPSIDLDDCGETRIGIKGHFHGHEFGGFDDDRRFRDILRRLGIADDDSGYGVSVEGFHQQPLANGSQFDFYGSISTENRGLNILGYIPFLVRGDIDPQFPGTGFRGAGGDGDDYDDDYEEFYTNLGLDLGLDLSFTKYRTEMAYKTPGGFQLKATGEVNQVDYLIQKDFLNTRFGGGLGFETSGFAIGANYEYQPDNSTVLPVPTAHRVTGELGIGGPVASLKGEVGYVMASWDGVDLDNEFEFTATARLQAPVTGDNLQVQGGMVNRDPVQRRVISTYDDYSDIWFIEAQGTKYLNKTFGLTAGVGYSDNDFYEDELYANAGAVLRF